MVPVRAAQALAVLAVPVKRHRPMLRPAWTRLGARAAAARGGSGFFRVMQVN